MTRALVPSRKVMVLFFGLRSGAAVEPDRSFHFRLRRSFLMERSSDESESGECGLMLVSLRAPSGGGWAARYAVAAMIAACDVFGMMLPSASISMKDALRVRVTSRRSLGSMFSVQE